MPADTSSSSPGVQAAEKLYVLLSAMYTTMNAAGLTIATVPVTEPSALQQQVILAVQAIRQA